MCFRNDGLSFTAEDGEVFDSEGFGLIVQFVIFPLFFLSGAIYPIESLPTVVQLLAYTNPLTYGVDGLRAVLVGTSVIRSLSISVLSWSR